MTTNWVEMFGYRVFQEFIWNMEYILKESSIFWGNRRSSRNQLEPKNKLPYQVKLLHIIDDFLYLYDNDGYLFTWSTKKPFFCDGPLIKSSFGKDPHFSDTITKVLLPIASPVLNLWFQKKWWLFIGGPQYMHSFLSPNLSICNLTIFWAKYSSF